MAPSFDELIKRAGERAGEPDTSLEARIAAEERKIQSFNRIYGELNFADGYECRYCLNRGYTWEFQVVNGGITENKRDCGCMEMRKAIRQMRASGLEEAIKRMQFGNYRRDYEWQEAFYDTARDYADNGWKAGSWFFVGGAVGCGKTHLCTAIARQLLKARTAVKYMQWVGESAHMKALLTEDRDYQAELRRLKTIPALYIDDFLKPAYGEDGAQPPTAADIRLAYDLINHRYTAGLITVISSERYLDEITEIDEAIGSRIYEKCKTPDGEPRYAFTVGRGKDRNWRMKAGG